MAENIGLKDFFNKINTEIEVFNREPIKSYLLKAIEETEYLVNEYPTFQVPQDKCDDVYKSWRKVLEESRKLGVISESYWDDKLKFWSSESNRESFVMKRNTDPSIYINNVIPGINILKNKFGL